MAAVMENPMVEKFNSTTHILYYKDKDIVMGKGVRAANDNMPVRAETTLCTIGRSGTMQFNFEGRTYQLHEGEIFIFPMNASISDFLFSTDFSCDFIAIANRLANDAFIGTNGAPKLIKAVYKSPMLSMNPSQKKAVDGTFNIIFDLLDDPYFADKDKVIKAYADAFLTVVGEIVSSHNKDVLPDVPGNLHGEQLVREFIVLQQDATMPGRTVGDIAERLNVTPKYLSTLVRQTTGKSPMQIITETTVQAIANMLVYSNDSIKEISNALHFDNLSFFGKYVRKHLGMSPTKYREEHKH